MDIWRKLSLTVVAVGIIGGIGGCSTEPPSAPERVSFEKVAVDQPPVVAPDIHLDFSRSEVTTLVAPPSVPIKKEESIPATVLKPVVTSPSEIPTATAPVVTNSKTKAVESVSYPDVTPVAMREVYVGLAGGQSVVDLGRGPVLFTLPAGFPPYVVEHDLEGGWVQFGTLSAGMTVKMSGLVTGSYTVGQIINVPKGGTTDEFKKFQVMPKVLLQTCVPGTDRMIVVGLY